MARLLYDHHTHTTFSHGKGSIEDNVKVAISKGLSSIAITDHGPGHLTYGVKHDAFPVMREEVDMLNEKYPEIEILLGIEANIVDTPSGLDLTDEDRKYLDFIIAGYHYGVRNGYVIHNYAYNHGAKVAGRSLMKKNTDMTIRALMENDIYILTHPGDKGPFDLDHIAAYCEKTKTLMEINSKHHHLTSEELGSMKEYDVNFIVSSDAHVPEKVGQFEEALSRATAQNISFDRIVNVEED
jgi:putative hydrolase